MPSRRSQAAWAYFDTSALIKRSVDEPGRRQVLQLLRGRACVTSAVLPVEIQSALRRKVSGGTLDGAASRAASVNRENSSRGSGPNLETV